MMVFVFSAAGKSVQATLVPIVGALILGGLLSVTAPIKDAKAILVSTSYEATVNIATGAGGANPAAFEAFLGENIRADIAFENDVTLNPDSNLSVDRGMFNLDSITIYFGGNSYSGTGGTVEVRNGVSSVATDLIVFSADAQISGQSVSGPTIDGITPIAVSVQFRDSTNSIFGDDSLPSFPPNPNDFDLSFISVVFSDGVSFGQVVAQNGISVVPEPGTLSLLGIGLLGLSAMRRRGSERLNVSSRRSTS